jgi:hypothetical protein
MNREQHAAARAVIEGAVLLCEGNFIEHNRKLSRGFVCCALAELAIGAGHRPDEVRAVRWDSVDYTVDLPKLAERYGLDGKGCKAIVEANDNPDAVIGWTAFPRTGRDEVDWPRARKVAVLQTLDELAGVVPAGADAAAGGH